MKTRLKRIGSVKASGYQRTGDRLAEALRAGRYPHSHSSRRTIGLANGKGNFS